MSKKDQTDADVKDSKLREKENTSKETSADVEQVSTDVPEDAGDTGNKEEQEEPSIEEQLSARVDELEDKLLRTAAEFDNYKKRVARQYDEVVRTANDRILVELLEVMDNFERALQHDNENSDIESFRKGTELIFNQMTALLNKYGVKPIEALGEPFDPNLHEAVMSIESEDYPEGVVAIEMSKGYVQGDRVLRHSKVGVSKGEPKDKKEGRK